ncbi:MAG TPA: hypothetical protein VMV90_06755 [Rectinemataceae bacterium]|nr:hypothetical protein [Rectinemataceae bacterium]
MLGGHEALEGIREGPELRISIVGSAQGFRGRISLFGIARAHSIQKPIRFGAAHGKAGEMNGQGEIVAGSHGLHALTPTTDESASVFKKEGNIASDQGAHGGQRSLLETGIEKSVEGSQHRGGVAGAAAESRACRNGFLDLDREAGSDAGSLPEGRDGLIDRGILRRAIETAFNCDNIYRFQRPDDDGVGQGNGLEKTSYSVVAVGAPPVYPQMEIDLRGGTDLDARRH